jgi:hypothetical protein
LKGGRSTLGLFPGLFLFGFAGRKLFIILLLLVGEAFGRTMPFAGFEVQLINPLILLCNHVAIQRKMRTRSALNSIFQGTIRLTTIAAGFLVPESRQIRQTLRNHMKQGFSGASIG